MKKFFTKKEILIGGIGALIGFLISLLFTVTSFYYSFSLPDLVVAIIKIPILTGIFSTSIILYPVCLISDPYTATSWCAGLGLDSGPAQWFEFLMIHFSFAFYLGLFFLITAKLFNFIKNRNK